MRIPERYYVSGIIQQKKKTRTDNVFTTGAESLREILFPWIWDKSIIAHIMFDFFFYFK